MGGLAKWEVGMDREGVSNENGLGFREDFERPTRQRDSVRLARLHPLSGNLPRRGVETSPETQKIDFGMCMLTSMCGTSTVSEIFKSPASEHSTYASFRVSPCSATR